METDSDPCSSPSLKPALPASDWKNRSQKIQSRKFKKSSGFDPAQADIRMSVAAITMRVDRPPAAHSQRVSFQTDSSASAWTKSSAGSDCSAPPVQNTGSASVESGWEQSSSNRSSCPVASTGDSGAGGSSKPVW